MWKPEHRVAADRRGLRYPSDMMDGEWTLVVRWSASITRSTWRSARRKVARRACRPPSSIARAPGRRKKGASIDAQGYDAGKKVTGRKRHILVDTLGLLLNVVVHPASVQDRDGAFDLLRRTCRLFPFVERIVADAAYQGPKMAAAIAKTGAWKREIVKRTEPHRFVVLPKRRVVERSFAWIGRNRRLTRDFERYARTVAAFVRLAMIRVMLRRLTRPAPWS